MKELELVSVCQHTKARMLRLKDSDQNLRVKIGGDCESVGGSEAKPPQGSPVWGVYVVRLGGVTQRAPGEGLAPTHSEPEMVAWKLTKAGAEAVYKDLTSLGVACYVELISPSPPEPAS